MSLNSSRGKRARETPTNDEDNDEIISPPNQPFRNNGAPTARTMFAKEIDSPPAAKHAFTKIESTQEGVLETEPTEVPPTSPPTQGVTPPSLSDMWDIENDDMPEPDQIRKMPALVPVNTLATSSLRQRFACCNMQEELAQWMRMYAAFSIDNPESTEQIINFLLELIRSHFKISLDVEAIRKAFQHCNTTVATQAELVHRIRATDRHESLIARQYMPTARTQPVQFEQSEQFSRLVQEQSDTRPTTVTPPGLTGSIKKAAIHMVLHSSNTHAVSWKNEHPDMKARMLIHGLQKQSQTLKMFLSAGTQEASDGTTPTPSITNREGELVSITRRWLSLRQKLHLKQVRDDDSIWDKIRCRKLFNAKCLRLSIRIWTGLTRSTEPMQSIQLQKWSSLRLNPLTSGKQIPHNLPKPLTQRLALGKADKIARIARLASCRTLFTEWHTSAIQSILHTRRRLGFGILTDWATTMWKGSFINMYANLVHPDKYHDGNGSFGQYTKMNKQIVQKAFNMILTIQQVTSNTTWWSDRRSQPRAQALGETHSDH